VADIVLTKFVIHDGSDRQTVLGEGAVEAVFTDGAGMNFSSVEQLNEFIDGFPQSNEAEAMRQVLALVREQSADFRNVDAIRGAALEVRRPVATVKP
jgi:hypothetical protein